MAKIGILINTEKIYTRFKEAESFDDEKYRGFKYIISEINKNKHTVDYIPPEKISDYDFALSSITSFYDYFNFVNLVKNINKGKCKIIVGGAGFFNIYPVYDYTDIAVFGRAEGQINDILDGKQFTNTWYKKNDPEIENKYEIRKPILFLPEEASIGCIKKCFFCQYGWTTGILNNESSNQYKGGLRKGGEDFFTSVDWSERRIITGLDGITEKERFVINKKITNKEIIDKLIEVNNYPGNDKNYTLKIYNIVGFPGFDNISYDEFEDCLYQASLKVKHKTFLMLYNSHFCPMPLTPMGKDRLVLKDYRQINWQYQNKNIKCIKLSQGSSIKSAFLELLINRCNNENKKQIVDIIKSGKILKCSCFEIIQIVKRYFKNLVCEQDESPIKYLTDPIGLAAAEKKYYLNKKEFCDGI